MGGVSSTRYHVHRLDKEGKFVKCRDCPCPAVRVLESPEWRTCLCKDHFRLRKERLGATVSFIRCPHPQSCEECTEGKFDKEIAMFMRDMRLMRYPESHQYRFP